MTSLIRLQQRTPCTVLNTSFVINHIWKTAIKTGLEDDEGRAGEKLFTFKLGDSSVVDALNDAVPGMTIGGSRRISILPEMGWRLPGTKCDGGPGGRGSGGELKTGTF